MKAIFQSILAVVLVVLLSSLSVSAAGTVGWIESFQGKPTEYSLIRDGKNIPVAIFLDLEPGDSLQALGEKSELNFTYADGRSKRVLFGEQVLVEGILKHAPTISHNVITWVGATVDKLFTQLDSGKTTVQMRTRGNNDESLKILGVQSVKLAENWLLEGNRTLEIAWTNSSGPVEVACMGGQQKDHVLYRELVNGKRVKVAELDLKAGTTLTIRIKDGTSRSEETFLIKPRAIIANAPEVFQDAQISVHLRDTLFSAWLAGSRDELLFEAFQVVSQVDPEYLPAVQLKRALARDMRPIFQFRDEADEQYLQGKYLSAIRSYETALALTPDDPSVLNNYAWVLATVSDKELLNTKRAVELSLRAIDKSGGVDIEYYDTLSTAYAADGQYQKAAKTTQKAINLCVAYNNNCDLENLERALEKYTSKI